MECPGLSGVWRACPASIPGLTPAERDTFQALGGPLLIVVALSLVVVLTIVAFSLTDGLAIGSSLRPRRWERGRRMDAAKRHTHRGRHSRLVGQAIGRRDLVEAAVETRTARIERGRRRKARVVPSVAAAWLAEADPEAYRETEERRRLRLRPTLAASGITVTAAAAALAAAGRSLARSARRGDMRLARAFDHIRTRVLPVAADTLGTFARAADEVARVAAPVSRSVPGPALLVPADAATADAAVSAGPARATPLIEPTAEDAVSYRRTRRHARRAARRATAAEALRPQVRPGRPLVQGRPASTPGSTTPSARS